MTDWSQWRAAKKPEKENTQPKFNPSEWRAVSPRDEPKENLLESAILAPFRVTADALKGAYDFATQKAPGYARQAGTEIPAFGSPLEAASHPLHNLGQVTAGALEGGQNANKAFREIPQYIANRLHLIPEKWANKIPVASDNPAWDITSAIQNTFGKPKYSGEAFGRGAARNLLGLGELGAIKQALPHLTRRGASMRLKRMRNLAEDRGLNPLSINPEIIEDLRQFLPNTSAYRNLLEASHAGNFGDLFNLQSDVGKHAGGLSRSFFSQADRAHGRAGLASRNALLDAIHDAIQAQGHNDISGLLRSGQRDYRRYMQFKPYAKLLGGTALGAGIGASIPENALTDLAERILLRHNQ